MAKYDFDSFDQGAQAVQQVQQSAQQDQSSAPALDLSSFDQAHDAAKQYAPEDQSNVTDAQAAGLNWGGPVTGIKQGALLGFGDEVAALSGALGAKTAGDHSDPRPFWDVYKDILDSTRQEQKQVQDAHPKSVLAGEVAGGFVSPLALVGGAGANASFLQKAGNAAKVGAIAGGTIGLGNSTADLTSGDADQYAQAAKDVGAGTAAGAALGVGTQAALSTGGAALRGTGNIVQAMPLTQDIMSVFGKTRAGQELLGQAENFSAKNRDLAKQVISDMTGLQQLSGEFMGGHAQDLNNSNATVDVQKVVHGLRQKIASMKPVRPEEQDELEAFKKTLSNMLDEQEQTTTSFIKKPQTNPNALNAEEKAERTVAQKTAEAQVSDQMKIDNIQDALSDQLNSTKPDEDEIARLSNLLAKAKNKQNLAPYNAQDVVDTATGLPVKAVNRGLANNPIVSAVMNDAEPLYTPLQKVQTTQTVAGRPTANMMQAQDMARSMQEGGAAADTYVGKQLYGFGKDALNQEMDTALQNATPAPGAPPIADSQAGYDAAKGQYYTTSTAKDMLNLPKSYGPFDSSSQVADTNRIQNMIRDYNQGGQKSQVMNEALDKLGEAYPGTAESLRREIANGSENEYLANALSKGNEYSSNWQKLLAGGKSTALQGARIAGKGANIADTTANSLTKLGSNVYDASPGMLQALADKATQTGQGFAGVLNQLVNAPDAKRKALLFTLMQQQSFRDFAHNSIPFTQDDDQNNN